MKKLWDQAELMAIEYLKKNNYHILEINFKYGRIGEIDIIGKKEDKVIFFEVKYRRNDTFWFPEESITKLKKQKIFYTIEFYCFENSINMEEIEFNVISIFWDLWADFLIKHYKNVDIWF